MTRLDSGKVSEALAHVERELAALWAPAEGEPPKSRVCTGNLVVVASHEGRARALELLDALEAADAARTFLVTVDPKLPLWAVETSVTARCRRDGDQLLCAERIDLTLGASAAPRAPSLLASLAMAEVPTTVLLLEPPPPVLVGPLLRHATRLVVDSDALGLEAVRALAGQTTAQLIDLAWGRLLPWRNQLAAAFDPPALRPAVSAVRRVQLTTTPPANGDLAPAARLLLGWLVSRLAGRAQAPVEARDEPAGQRLAPVRALGRGTRPRRARRPRPDPPARPRRPGPARPAARRRPASGPCRLLPLNPGATLVILQDTLVAADSDALARMAAHFVRAWLREATSARGVARIAVSGGSTPRAMMKLLAGMTLPWSATEWFWVDERFVPHDHPRSNYGAAKEDLFDRLSSPPGAVYPMPGEGSLEEGADAYEAALVRSFGLPRPADGGTAPPCFDLLLLGIGDDGHTASLFPGDDAVERSDRWVLPVAATDEREARLTLSRPVITAARRVVMLAQGESKREPLRQARAEGPLREIPSRLTREVESELLWLLDRAAAG